jgi:plasmid stability protein
MQTCEMKIRVPADLRERLSTRAAGNRRSINGEILTILEEVVKAEVNGVVPRINTNINKPKQQ